MRHGRIAQRETLLTHFFTWARGTPTPLPILRSTTQWTEGSDAGPPWAFEVLHGLLDSLQEEIVLLDEAGVVIAANAAWRASCPHPNGLGGVGEAYITLCAEFSPDLDQEAFREGVGEVMAGRAHAFSFDFASGPDARRRRARITPVSLRGAPVLFAVHEDLEHGARAGAGDVLAAQDEERKRIAMELHDSTSQHLAVLGLGMTRLRRIVGAPAEAVLDEMSRTVAEVVREIRGLSFLMRPAGLERQGLVASTRAFVKGFGLRTGLDAEFSTQGPVDEVAEVVRHAAYRVVQEGLSNAFKHARATRVDVRLELANDVLRVFVADDGVGVPGLVSGDLSGVQFGVGILGMQTRAAQLGGRLEISCEGGGTELLALLPARAAATPKAPDPEAKAAHLRRPDRAKPRPPATPYGPVLGQA